jgi:hypothetical protein
MIKQLAVSGAILAAVILPASAAHATGYGPDADCSDFSTPVKIVGGYDPAHLDNDHDGVGCEDNAGDPMAYDLYANLKGDEPSATPSSTPTGTPSASPTLAHTGAGDLIHKHPVRSIGLGVALVGMGGLITFVARRHEN